MPLWQCTNASIHFSLLFAAGHRMFHIEWKEERKIPKYVKFFKIFAGFRKLKEFFSILKEGCYFIILSKSKDSNINYWTCFWIASRIITIKLSNIVRCFMFIAFYVFFVSNPQIMGHWTDSLTSDIGSEALKLASNWVFVCFVSWKLCIQVSAGIPCWKYSGQTILI